MGFGLLFLGYFVAYLVSFAFPVKIFGYALMIFGCEKLSEYNTKFKLCNLPLGFLSLAGLYSLVYKVYEWLSIESFLTSDGVYKAVSSVGEAFEIAYHACLLIAICAIAKETELHKMAYKAMRNLLIIIAGEIAYFVAILLPAGSASNVAGYISAVLRLVWIALDLWLIANCYRLICPEGEEDMPKKESKLSIIRKMDAVINKREEEAMETAHKLTEKRKNKTKAKKIQHKKRK